MSVELPNLTRLDAINKALRSDPDRLVVESMILNRLLGRLCNRATSGLSKPAEKAVAEEMLKGIEEDLKCNS